VIEHTPVLTMVTAERETVQTLGVVVTKVTGWPDEALAEIANAAAG
jgi:hypothetical protein